MSDKLMDRIQKLINQANAAGTPEEAATFLAKANDLKFQHKIDDIMLKARNAANAAAERKRSEPIVERADFVGDWDQFYGVHLAVLAAYAKLTGCRLVLEFGGSQIAIFGYPEDVQYLRMLWVGSHLTFSSKLYPKWEPTLSDGANIKNMAEAGYKWKEIWAKGRIAGGLVGVAEPPADNGKMKRLYAKACRDQGVEKAPLATRNQVYRESYAAAFRNTIIRRTYDLILKQERRVQAAGDGAGLVLRKEATAIDDLVAATYPEGLGETAKTDHMQVKDYRAGERGEAAASEVDMTAGNGGVGAADARAELG